MFFTICTILIVKSMLFCIFFAQIYKQDIVIFYNFAPYKKATYVLLAKIREFYNNPQIDQHAHNNL